jgi:hypothetical protein
LLPRHLNVSASWCSAATLTITLTFPFILVF